MASIQHYTTRKGEDRWRVRFPSVAPGYENTTESMSFAVEDGARNFCRLINTRGVEYALRFMEKNGAGKAPPRKKSSPTVGQYVDKYITELTGRESSIRALKGIGNLVKNYIGDYRIDSLDDEEVSRFLDEVERDGYSYNYRSSILAVLRRSMKLAVKDKVITSLPNLSAHQLKGIETKKRRDTLLLEEVDEFLALMPADQDCHLVSRLILGTGLRAGEALALRVRDLDFSRNAIRVASTLTKDLKGNYKIGLPKTRTSNRLVGMGANADMLRKRIEGKGRNDFVFTREDGSMWGWNSWYHSGYKMASDLFEVSHGKRITPHCLRHTYSTLLLRQGKPMPIVSHSLGHSSIAITVDTYGHFSEEDILDLGDPIATLHN